MPACVDGSDHKLGSETGVMFRRTRHVQFSKTLCWKLVLSSFQHDTSSVAQRGWERFASFPLCALCVRSFLTLTCFYVFTCGHSEIGMFSMSGRPPGLSSGVFGRDEPDSHLGSRYCCLIKRCHAREHILAGQSV